MKKPPHAITEARHIFTLIFALFIVCWLLNWMAACVALLLLFAGSLFFFRDPKRKVVSADGEIMAAADGKVMEIQDMVEEEFMEGPCRKVTIFLSIFNVHVNRAPEEGRLIYECHKPGKFGLAMKEKASGENERNSLGFEGKHGRYMVRQIAGMIARRIVCWCEEGAQVVAGEKIGMIRFGSRTEIYFRSDCKVHVKVGESVRAGLTRIASYDE